MDMLPVETPVNQVSLPQIEFYGAGHYSVTSQAPARERCKSDFRLGIWHIALYNMIIDEDKWHIYIFTQLFEKHDTN